jgi:hypothetical protein
LFPNHFSFFANVPTFPRMDIYRTIVGTRIGNDTSVLEAT